MFVPRVHVFLSLPHGVSSTPPCTTLIERRMHVIPSHVDVLGIGSVVWVGGGGEGEDSLEYFTVGNWMIWRLSCSPSHGRDTRDVCGWEGSGGMTGVRVWWVGRRRGE